jgi:predicted AAA+ superfamily ATPase
MLNTISNEEIIQRLSFDNPWWKDDEVEKVYQDYPKRFYFDSFYKLIDKTSINRAVILMGPRRVGKTVMVYHGVDKLLKQGVKVKNILYISLETPIYTGLSLEKLLNIFIDKFQHNKNELVFIFFDEIQYLNQWEVHLKSLVDSYPNYQFIATGSAAAALKLKSKESGAGRFTDFLLPPLTFAEYLDFINWQGKLSKQDTEPYKINDIELLNNEFINYLNYGGYPEAVFSALIQQESSRYIKSDIIDKVLLRDLPSLYGINDVQELNKLFTTIAYNTGNEINLESLSKSSGVSKKTITKYIEYLEAAFLIQIVNRVDINAKKFKRATSFKIYLTNASMRAALFGPIKIDDNAMGALTETVIFSQWFHQQDIDLHYARWHKGKDKGEVDIVNIDKATQKANWAIEVKWSDLAYSDDRKISPIINFAKKII